MRIDRAEIRRRMSGALPDAVLDELIDHYEPQALAAMREAESKRRELKARQDAGGDGRPSEP
ncbi:hypothetical protein [Brevundimonas sp.]|uniref:hypothetical protein n=1 Tax=Brevundimonas sp. TaxID=1871086 RepID=UPI002D2EFB72|nr:hypothetical protein [Brevundimonas sp.]HYD26968.1 hypothetical protein [Brevundimonas sp.]